MVLGIYGAGATAKELYEMLVEMHHTYEEICFIDDTQEIGTLNECRRMPFTGFCNTYSTIQAKIVIAMGEPASRELVYNKVKQAGYVLETIVHPTSIISPTVILGQGSVVKMGTLISCDVVIGDNVYIQSNTTIGHGVHIGKNSIVSARAFIAGETIVGEKVFVGINSCIRENINVGNNAIIAMAAAVMKDVSENATVIGNPARMMVQDSKHKVF